jgi:hypothetical protein
MSQVNLYSMHLDRKCKTEDDRFYYLFAIFSVVIQFIVCISGIVVEFRLIGI